MYLCENNLTLVIYAVFINDYHFARNNVVQGLLGRHTQKMIKPRKSHKNLCTLVNEEKVGDKLPNGSYDGALGLIEKKLIDAIFRSEHGFIDSDLVGFTQPTYSENYLIGQSLKDKTKNSNESAMFSNFFDFFFLLCCLAAMVAFLFLSSGLLWTLGRRKLLKQAHFVLKLIVYRKVRRLSRISLALVGLGLFYFLVKQIFLINIKTNKVIVDTSKVIYNEEKLFESDLKAIWIEGERDQHLAMTSPVGTPLRRLYDTKNSDPIMKANRDRIDDKEQLLDKGFFFTNSLSAVVLANLFSQLYKLDFFLNPHPFYSTYNVMYRIKEKSVKTQAIDTSLSQLVEAGFFEKYINDMKTTKMVPGIGTGKIYNSLEEYIEDHTVFEPIKLNNLYHIFLIYFLVISSLLVAFLTHQLVGWIIRILRNSRKFVKKAWTFILLLYDKKKIISKIFIKKLWQQIGLRQTKSNSHPM